jgi:preprotein translocase subunit SecA
MDDDLMRLFGGDRLKAMMERLNVPEDVPLQNGMVSRSIESAQKRVEGHHFDLRKHVLQYDNVMNKHRDIIYKRRQKILERIVEAEGGKESGARSQELGDHGALHHDILASIQREAEAVVKSHAVGIDSERWNVEGMRHALSALHPALGDGITEDMLRGTDGSEDLTEKLKSAMVALYEEKCKNADSSAVSMAERVVTLRAIDTHWMDHIDDMSHLREQVAFSGYAQKDPLIEYQDQGFRRFQQLLANIESTIVRTLLQIDFAQFAPRQILEQAQAELNSVQTNDAEISGELETTGVGEGLRVERQRGMQVASGTTYAGIQSVPQQKKVGSPLGASPQVGRNDPCPCGSGKKFKKCHGKDL